MTTVLLTGGSGFIGSFVARWLLDRTDTHIIALVRGGDDEDAVHRLGRAWADILGLAETIGGRVVVMAGDVTQARLGLDEGRYAQLVRDTNVVIHSAADIRLDAPLEELRRTNVEGTRNALVFAEEVHRDHGLDRFSHVSTAYVAGGKKGKVSEDDLTDENGFLSNYERSKYEAEVLVREKSAGMPTSVFRPGMVVGSSENGYVRTFNTLYYPLRLYLSGKLRFLPISPFQPVNLVPVDHVAEAIGRLTLDPRATGRTFHLVGDPATLPSVREVVEHTREWALKNLRVELPAPIYVPSYLVNGLAARGEARKLSNLEGYLRERREFQRDNLDELLGPYPVDWRQLLPRLLEFGVYTGFLHRSERTVHEQVLFRLGGTSRPVRLFDIVEGEVKERPVKKVRQDMLTAAAALRSLGIREGDRVAIVGTNSTRFLTLDVAIGLVGGVSVPLYYTSPPQELDEQIGSSGAKLLLVGSAAVLARMGEMGTTVPVVSFCREMPDELRGRVMEWEELMAKGAGAEGVERSPAGFHNIATLRYTSSTTGKAKGVLFKHHHLRFMAESTASLPPWEARNSEIFYLSFLPMNHVVEGILATYSPFYAPAPINLYFLEDFRGLRDALPLVRPTVFFSVPRFYERLHDGLMASRLFRGILADPKGLTAAALAPVVRRKALRRAGLDRCAYLISGSGLMSPEILLNFRAVGIEVHNAYGQTEAPLVTINYRGRNRIGTVGEPLPRTEVAIAPDGEVLVRGPQVTCGYDGGGSPLRDGWLLTGDTGRLTKDGSLVLEGRKKELIKTSYGKFINPLKVETALRDLPGVAEAMLVGEGRPYVIALLWMEEKASADGIDAAIEAVNVHLSHPEQVKAWALLPNDLSVDSGVLTANMKLRRPKAAERYRDVIEALYADAAPTQALHSGRARRQA